MKVLVFGSCNIDIVYSMNTIVRPKETVGALACNTFPGGKGFNQAIALSKAGVSVYFAGCIGTDGIWLKDLLDDNGTDTSLLKTTDTKSGQAIIQVDSKGQNAIFVYQGANGEITKNDVDAVLSHFDSGDMIILQNEISELFYIINRAFDKGMKIILNPSPFNSDFLNLELNKITCLVVNETESCEFSGTDNPFDLITKVQNENLPTQILLTLGENGSAWWDGQKLTRFGIFKTKVVDTTAAGDTFIGYFISGLLSGKSAEDVLKVATAASAVSISRHGASSSIPTQDEVKNVIKYLDYNDYLLNEQNQRVTEYLHSHLQNANLNDLAKLLGFSKKYVGKWIISNFGRSFTAILQDERITVAAEQLIKTNSSVEDIISAVGYNNGGHFRRIFKKKYGVSPLEYKKENKLC